MTVCPAWLAAHAMRITPQSDGALFETVFHFAFICKHGNRTLHPLFVMPSNVCAHGYPVKQGMVSTVWVCTQ
jgi:hypothetical protein